MDILILRFNAPLMSFGAPIIDRHGEIQPYPALSLITGLLANALGFDHADAEEIQRLQKRIQYASRQDRAGEQIQDYQTVDLSQDFMRDEKGWTTRGWLDQRKGGSASKGTHIRLRDYRADAIHTVALTLTPIDDLPTIDDLEDALRVPERPLFIGRKTCLPATSLLIDRREEENLTVALQKVPAAARADERKTYPIWWAVDEDENHPEPDMKQPVTDRRDWSNQIHVGERWIAKGEIQLETE